MLINKSAIRKFCKAEQFQIEPEYIQAFELEVQEVLRAKILNAKKFGKKRLMVHQHV
jgi:hypothetical protein